MAFPAEIARQFTEDKIAFVKRMNLKAEVLEPGFVRLRVPLAGNENHIGSMYAGALFTLAEIPGGALFLTSFDASNCCCASRKNIYRQTSKTSKSKRSCTWKLTALSGSYYNSCSH